MSSNKLDPDAGGCDPTMDPIAPRRRTEAIGMRELMEVNIDQ